jgi:N-acetylmuramoyl-L-alanine amidase
MQLIPHPSPNHDARPSGATIDSIILHYTDMESAESALARLCDVEASVSAHYLIAADGRIFTLVEEERRAWHAGESHWRGINGINATSIGIELDNAGHAHGHPDFAAPQMDALLELLRALKERYKIADRNIIGHSDIAFLRKRDPGEKFPWGWLAENDIGIFPFTARPISGAELKRGDSGTAVMKLQQSLANWGYGLKVDGAFAEKTEACVIAFQRHFRPENVSGVWDSDCAGRLAMLHAMV